MSCRNIRRLQRKTMCEHQWIEVGNRRWCVTPYSQGGCGAFEQKSGEPDMNINDVISADDRFLKAPDLQGCKVSVRIESFTVENFKEKKQIVLKFFGAKKVLGLNKINTKMIASMHGNEVEEWIAMEVVLFPSKTQNQQGQIVDCIRIEYQVPSVAAPGPFVSGLAGTDFQVKAPQPRQF